MAQLGHKNHLCDAWSCASFGNKDKHNQTAGTRLRKFHRSCAVLNTLPYVFFHSYPTSGLLFNCVLCFNTIDGATDNLQYCFDNAVSQMPFNTFKCTKRTTAYGTVQYTVKGQSRSDSLLLSPYHWAKLFRGVVAIVAVPIRFAVICWIVLKAFVGQIHVFPLGSWMTIQVPGLSRISFWKSYWEAVRLEKVQVSHHHNF